MTLIRNIVIGAALTVALLAGAAWAVVYLGVAPVAATRPHHPWVQSWLHTAYHQRVHRMAEMLALPDAETALDEVELGAAAHAFAAMCAGCHTPPGQQPTPRALGLNPEPPDSAALSGHLNTTQAFWVIKHGVRMTGMPAFGPTHSDAELLQIAKLLRTPAMRDAQRYSALLQTSAPDDGHNHTHADAPTDAGHGNEHGDGHGYEHSGAHAATEPSANQAPDDDAEPHDHDAHDHSTHEH